ncbi:MAG TPA: hypothetical protein VKA89_06820 [Solirubrobacterales bacterium]|nr:hypothetical protein [Solirubrobacterales bacterium]
MEATRPQPIQLEGLDAFLVDHEECGGGFDVVHPTGLGGGRVSMVCRGCGARHEFATASIEVEREVRIERVAAPRRRPTAPRSPGRADCVQPRMIVEPAPRPEPVVERPPDPPVAPPAEPATRPQPQPPRRRHAPISLIRNALLVLAGAGLAVAAILALTETGDDPAAPPSEPAAEAGAEVPGTVAPGVQGGGLETLRTPGFTLRTPVSWTRQRANGGLIMSAPAGAASVTVYAGREFSVAAGGPGGRETLAGRSRFLLVRTVRRDASPEVRAQARAVQASFQAR